MTARAEPGQTGSSGRHPTPTARSGTAPEAPGTEQAGAWGRLLARWAQDARGAAAPEAAGARQGGWPPPDALGPLPEALREEALSVLDAQGEAIGRLRSRLTAVAVELAAAQPAPRAARTRAAVYLDTFG